MAFRIINILLKIILIVLIANNVIGVSSQSDRTELSNEQKQLDINNSLNDQFEEAVKLIHEMEEESNVHLVENEFLSLRTSGQKLFLLNDDDVEAKADVKRTAEEIVISRGYQFQSHQVETPDGYILKMFRIPCSSKINSLDCKEETILSKPAVLLIHGLLDSSDCWIVNKETQAIAFRLVNKGYDVWLGNTRGNKYALSHKTLDYKKNKAEFWNFSFHEKGIIDIISLTKYIISVKGEGKKISYIGHSQGTSAFFAGFSESPEFFKASFNGMLALGPVTSLFNIGSTAVRTMMQLKFLEFLKYIGYHQLMADDAAVSTTTSSLCRYFKFLCTWATDAVAGADKDYDDFNRILVYMSHYPTGASIKEFEHLKQSKECDCFRKFKSNENYDISAMRGFKLGLFVGKSDLLATVADNRGFREKLLEETDALKFYKEYEHINHLSFFVTKSEELFIDLELFLDDLYK